MKVVKRDGRSEEVQFDKILHRNQVLCATSDVMKLVDAGSDLYQILSTLKSLDHADATFVTQQAIKGVYDGVTTQELDVHSAMISQSLALIHPDYADLASRITASNLQKNVLCRIMSEFAISREVASADLMLYVTRAMWQNRDVNNAHSPLIAPYFRAVVEKNREWINSVIDYTRDYNFDYVGYSMLEKSYLIRTLLSTTKRREIIEQPQHLFMRVAIGIECAPVDPVGVLRTATESSIMEMMEALRNSLAGSPAIRVNTEHLRANLGSFLETTIVNATKQNAAEIYEQLMSDPTACVLTPEQRTHIKATYDMMSLRLATHATPTLFNAGSLRPQCSSCYLIGPTPDSMEGITDVWRSESLISKWAGGIGSVAYSLRPKGSYIAGTNGVSNGLVPKLKVDNDIATYVDQGGNIRPGSNAVYNSAWHGDIFAFLDLRKERGVESERARELFYGMWLSDEFMRSVIHKKQWYLMCPNQCPGLYDVYDHQFETEWLTDEFVDSHQDQFAFTHLYRSYVRAGKYLRTVAAIDVWRAICDSQIETGLPYMLYKDSINRKSNQRNAGTIKSSNLCVAPETRILTRDGYRAIATLVDTRVEVWNGFEWSETVVRKTGTDQPLLYITFTTGVIECTPYHKFYIQHPTYGTVQECSASALAKGDTIVDFVDPISGTMVTGTRVLSVANHGRCSDTYCFTEPLRHMGVFNGILAGNCTEITEYTDNDETAVCNLTSLCLNNFWNSDTGLMDWDLFRSVVRTCVYNLNRVIDLNFYPTMKTYRSNMRHRPMGIGVQGLADLFAIRRVPVDSMEARQINFEIFERMYYYALEMSCELAETSGTYPSYAGSPMSEGKFQFDLWLAENARPRVADTPVLAFALQMPWEDLRARILAHGVRNSLLIAPMPTASTAYIMGNSQGFEPYNSTVYKRPNKSGEFVIINKHLVRDLLRLGLWDEDMRSRILGSHGGIQEISAIPMEIRKLYKTVWDLEQKVSIDLALDRAVFIDQSQSMNQHVGKPTVSTLSKIQFYSWKRGVKTGSYYIWGRPPIEAQKIQIKKSTNKMLKKATKSTPEKGNSSSTASTELEPSGPVCTMEAGCLTCGS